MSLRLQKCEWHGSLGRLAGVAGGRVPGRGEGWKGGGTSEGTLPWILSPMSGSEASEVGSRNSIAEANVSPKETTGCLLCAHKIQRQPFRRYRSSKRWDWASQITCWNLRLYFCRSKPQLMCKLALELKVMANVNLYNRFPWLKAAIVGYHSKRIANLKSSLKI